MALNLTPDSDGLEKAREAVRRIRAEREHEERWDWLLEPPEQLGCLVIVASGAVLLGVIYLCAWLFA